MTDRQLFIVTLSDSLVVLAKDADEATTIARRNILNADIEVDEVRTMDHYPGDWDEEAVPFAQPDVALTVGELVQQGAAPHMRPR